MLGLTPYERRNYNLFNYFDDLEKQFFGGDMKQEVSHFRTDIRDEGDKFVLEAELPGFKKEDIKIDLHDDTLTVSAVHEEKAEDKKHNYNRRERKFGSYSRSFDVTNIDTQNIQAGYENGILTLDLPKQTETKPPRRSIEIR